MGKLFANLHIVATGMVAALWLSAIAVPAAAEEPLNKLTAAALEHRTRLDYDGESFSGPALEQLLAGARDAQFFLIGEEHGIAENPKLAAQLFRALVADDYAKLAIEVSPPMAAILDAAARSGIDGLSELFALPGGQPAFFGMQEEAEMLVAVRAALPDAEEVFWGVDYEVAGDRSLLRALEALKPPASAAAALEKLLTASHAAWDKYYASGEPQHIFTFSGDPALVTAVIEAWPDAGHDARSILNTLRHTLEINQLWVQGRAWDSNARRAAFFRANFLDYWQDAVNAGKTAKVMVKLGGNHVVRGRNMTGTYDLGALLPELAELHDSRVFSVLVLPGPEALTAVLDPTTWSYVARPAKDNYAKGLTALTDAAFTDAFTLIDLTALRPVVGSGTASYGVATARVVHGFDSLLVMSGSTASRELQHEQAASHK